MRSRRATLVKLIRAWSIFSLFWIAVVGWETYQHLPAPGAVVPTGTTQRVYSRPEVIKIGAALALVPPALLFIGGAHLIKALTR